MPTAASHAIPARTNNTASSALKLEIADLRRLAARHGYKPVDMTAPEYVGACEKAVAEWTAQHQGRTAPNAGR